MRNSDKTREQLLKKLEKSKKRITELIGRNVTEITYDAKDENLTYLNNGKLHLYKEG